MNKFFDVVIVGTGVSGLYTAMNLRQDLKILVVCKDKITTTNTFLAQGGISVARNIDAKLTFPNVTQSLNPNNLIFFVTSIFAIIENIATQQNSPSFLKIRSTNTSTPNIIKTEAKNNNSFI